MDFSLTPKLTEYISIRLFLGLNICHFVANHLENQREKERKTKPKYSY